VGSVAVGLALRWALSGVLGSSVPYITLYPAVVFAASFGGLGPGILAAVLSVAAVLPMGSPTFADAVRAGIFGGFSILFSVFTEALRRARQRIDRGRELLHITLSSVGDAVISTDAKGNVTFLNAVAQELTGWNQQDAEGKAIADVFVVKNEKTGLAAEIPVDRVLREGVVVNLANHTVLRSKDGRDIPIEDSAAPICDERKRVLGVVLVFRDVTARRRSEEALKKSEERLKLALNAGRIGVWDWDIARNRIAWSDQVYELFGLEPGTFNGEIGDFMHLVHPEDRKGIEEAVRAALEDGAPYEPEFRTFHARKGVRWMSNSGQVHRNEKGEPVRMLGSVIDITERKQAEAQLLQQWHTFDTALSNTPDFTYVFDLEGRFTYVNRALLSLWQRPLEDAVGKNFFDLEYPPQLAERLQRQIQQVIDTKEPLRDSTPFTGPDGETGHYEYIFVPILSGNGDVEAVAGSTRDVTERSRTEEALRKSEERLNFALEAGGGVGTWDYDVRSDRLYSNARFAEIFSVDPKRAAAGAPMSDFIDGIHPDDRGMVAERVQRAIETGGDYSAEYRVIEKGGSICWLSGRGRGQRDEAGNPIRFPGVVIDITDRKRTEGALWESQERFSILAECIPQMIWTAKADGALDYVSGQTADYFAVAPESLLGAGWLEGVHADDRAHAMERWRNSIQTGEPYETAFRLRRGRDGSWRWHLVRALPLTGDSGRIVQWFGTCTDIEDQKVTEADLTRVNRELEEFAYVASHDLQEPLRMVNIYTELILDEMGLSGTEMGQYAGYVRQGVARMEGLIHDLLTFSRAVHSDRLPVGTADLSDALSEALAVLKSRIEECGAAITAEHLPKVRGDAGQMAHVFQNLVSNALKYSKQGIAPLVHVSARQDGNFWIIAIRDNGIGFEPQYAERIFGLFKRLYKEEYPGTGLGLAICKRIVERYGGRIWAEGRPGDGATFYFMLPRAE
jgi:PAS domain S-box-containing protein